MIENPTKQNFALGYAWYRREQWERLRAVSADAADLEDTYDEWMKTAKRTVKALRRQGVHAQKVDVDVEELVRWCQKQNRAIDSEARSAFVVDKLQKGET